jgi:hypothetical protein
MDEKLTITTQRLRDDLLDLRGQIRKRYNVSQQVIAAKLKSAAAGIAESWLVNIATRPQLASIIGESKYSSLSVSFQKLLTISEHATTRSKYEAVIAEITRDFSNSVLIPVKKSISSEPQTASERQPLPRVSETLFTPTAFVAHSFLNADQSVASCVIRSLEKLNIKVVTGEKPRGESISQKIRNRIDQQFLFVGVFTRRDKIYRKDEWTTSTWVIEEKAYAYSRRKKLILVKESGVGSIGGIQGDYQIIQFDRDHLETVPLSLLDVFQISLEGLSNE